MTLDLEKPLPHGSYAWCGECPWRSESGWAHKNAQAHTNAHEHVTHVYEAEEKCPEVRLTPLGQAWRCELHREHGENHRATLDGGAVVTWPVENPVESGGN